MATVRYGQRYWRARHGLPADVQRALAATVRELEDAPSLPGPADVFDIIPPTLHVWRRRIGASAWWGLYETRPDGAVILVAVAVPP